MTLLQTHYLNAKRLDDEAIKALTFAVIPHLGTGMHARRAIQRIVRNYFLPAEKKVTDRSLMTGTGWTLEKLHDYKRMVREFLCGIRESLLLAA